MDAGRMTCLALLILSLLAAPISCSPWDFYDSEPPTDYQLQVGFIFSSMSIIMNGSTACCRCPQTAADANQIADGSIMGF